MKKILLVFILIFSLTGCSSSKNDSVSQKECVTAGCSGQLCVAKGQEKKYITTCEFKDEYTCLALTKCELQPDNTCGWTKSAEYQECYAEKGPKYEIWPQNKIIIHSPVENQLIGSLVAINGAASGDWYNNGSFLVIITDDNNKELGRGRATMSGGLNIQLNSANFLASIKFDESETLMGYVILAKDETPLASTAGDVYRLRVQLQKPATNKNDTMPVS